MCEFGELSADAGSLAHLASAKEKGTLLHCCGEGSETKLLGIFFTFILKQQGKCRTARILVLVRNNSGVNVVGLCIWSLLFVVPISQLSRKNVFLIPRTSDGVSAQQEKTSSLWFISASDRGCCVATCIVEIVSCVVAPQNQEMSTFIAGK